MEDNFKVGSPNLFIEAIKDSLWSISSLLTQCMSSRTKTITINNTEYTILKYLSEGAFSYVYLVQNSHGLYALKKITNDGFEAEVSCYQRFKSKFIINLLNYSIQDGAINLIFPYFKNGNLQDYINVNNAFDEKTALKLFSGVCQAVAVLHNYNTLDSNSYPPSSIDDDDEGTDAVPYAHRDIKPGNVMLTDNALPVLMDFGSCIKARVRVNNRSEALIQQDMAAEHSSMPYRAPELFDVKSDTTLDEKVDIWSLGCTLYALTYSHSPFEDPKQAAQGGSIAMAVQSGRYNYPSNDTHSDGFKNVIDACLRLNPAERPSVDELIRLTESALSESI
ncbi:kinase-like protein [Wallemia mellicola CBS 633.66]|uniref:non-specific serine/threonine protein kinase n=1 Tax=Wallemia mellicola (strain ATCC MYA-4683 / CBS 633.66) TaxID=671144 RepID=I4YIY1_WALMC|nr:kinase-like protein [Wallemia mellicola CBS 633.66]EIM23923.1 kinase-like protein [Wallemia mellicola CBS 633.66]|eukprot:XP_006955764.1 kinase-like protein [Wallemia mellicola CBS 633.66]